MNVYDFDKTIYDGDSTTNFYLFCLKKRPWIAFGLFRVIIPFAAYLFGKGTKTAFKEQIYKGFLPKIKDKREEYLAEFWKKNFSKIKKFYLDTQKDDDIIISASPLFVVKPCTDKLGIKHLYASDVHPDTGVYDGINCHGEEKVRRFELAGFKREDIDEFYSDSLSDTPLAKISKKAFIVIGEKLVPWEEYKSSGASSDSDKKSIQRSDKIKKLLKSIFCSKRIPVLVAFALLAAVLVMICVMLSPERKSEIPDVQADEITAIQTPVVSISEEKNTTVIKAETENTAPLVNDLYIAYSNEYNAKKQTEQNALCRLDGKTATELQNFNGEKAYIKYAPDFPVFYIGSSFKLPKQVKTLQLPDSVVGILSKASNKLSDSGAFYANKTLEAFLPSDSLKYIGNKAFYECVALSDVFFPTSLEHIGDRAFYGCTALTSIKLHGRTTIGEGAFAGCSLLTDVYLSENIRRVGLGAFDNTPFYDGMTEEFGIVGDILVKYNGKSENVVIPEGVRLIADGVFAGRLSVKSVTFPASIEYIGNSAFRSCARLSEVKITGMPVIGANAFDGCASGVTEAVSGLYVDERDAFFSEANSDRLEAE